MHPVQYSQALTASAGTMVSTAGQVISTSTGNFPQQLLPGCLPTNANQSVIIRQYGVAANQQSLSNFRPKTVASGYRERNHTFQSQLPVLPPNSLYTSFVPVHSSAQIFNGCHMREISSQPQIITTQASGTMLNQAQLLGLQTVNSLPPGLSWAPSGLQLCQNPFILYNQPSGMAIHQSQPQMAMHLPATTAAVVAPRVQKYFKLMPKEKIEKGPSFGQQNQSLSTPVAQLKSIAVSQTDPNLERKVNDQTKSTGIEDKSVSFGNDISSPQRPQATALPISRSPALTIGSCTVANPSLKNTETFPLHTEMNQAPSTSIEFSSTCNETYPNPVQAVNDLTKSTGIERKTVSVETEISSSQKSQASVTPFSKITQACLGQTVNASMIPSDLTTGSSTDASPFPPSIQRATSQAEINQMLCIPNAQQKSNACIEICLNPVQSINDLIKSTGIECKTVSVETKISSSHTQKSQASVTPFSKIPLACVDQTVNASMTPSALATGSSTDANPFPPSIQRATSHAEINQVLCIPNAQQKSNACNEICLNPVQSINDLTNSTGIESKSVSVETNIFSLQKSQATVTPLSQFLQACVVSTPTADVSVISVAPSNLTVASSTVSAMTKSSVSSIVSTCSIPTVSPVSPISSITNRVLSDFNSNSSLSKTHNEAVVRSHKTNTTETMFSSKPFRPEQLIQKLSLDSVKDKQPQKATIKPQVLIHVIDGFIIQESSEPFPVSQSPLLDLPCRVLSTKKLYLPEEKENSPAISNPENKVRALRPQNDVEFCGKIGPKSRAKQFDCHISKQVERPSSSIQGHVGSGLTNLLGKHCSKSGRGRKRKRFRRKSLLQKQLLAENESISATPAEEILPTCENESAVSCKTDGEKSTPFDNSHRTPMEVNKSSDEIGLLKSSFSQKLPIQWTVQDVFEFIQNVPGCSDYADNFKSQEVDGQALLLLNEDHLKTALCMKLGPALKLLSQIRITEEKLQSQLHDTSTVDSATI